VVLNIIFIHEKSKKKLQNTVMHLLLVVNKDAAYFLKTEFFGKNKYISTIVKSKIVITMLFIICIS